MCSTAVCFIVPPYILEGLARKGSMPCKFALNDTQRILVQRNRALNNLLLRNYLQTGGKRSIYDSKNRYEQRLNLVRYEGSAESSDATVNAAFDHSGYVREFFRDRYGLNSIDNRGMPIISNVHYGQKYNNAFWDGDEMTYGDGDGMEFRNFASAIDVVAHELTHGITQFLANLEYYGQSGALNEHFSDVFASAIKQNYLGQNAGTADWLIGDTIVTEGFPGKAIRSLRNPGTANDFDRQPDHMDRYYEGSADNQGVHINSGIPNKAFFLAATALGTETASLVWFHTLQELWRTANFQDMLQRLLEVSARLESEGKVPGDTSSIITESFGSVGILTVGA